MAGIKRTPADIAFSKCVRERSGWRCERCGTQYPENSGGVECSHGYTRGAWGVRFHPLNAEALCTGCHFREGGLAHLRKSLTEWESDRLDELYNDTMLGKQCRKTKGKGEIARHYRDQHDQMRSLRECGVTMRLEFDFWL